MSNEMAGIQVVETVEALEKVPASFDGQRALIVSTNQTAVASDGEWVILEEASMSDHERLRQQLESLANPERTAEKRRRYAEHLQKDWGYSPEDAAQRAELAVPGVVLPPPLPTAGTEQGEMRPQ